MKVLIDKLDTNTETIHRLEDSLKDDIRRMKADVAQQNERIDALDRKMAHSAQEQANEIAQIVEGQLTESLKS
ncbi:unnamed protein product, partial [Prorocentrum cordatum]